MPEISVETWENLIQSLPEGHLLQTGTWGKLKGRFGWEARHLLIDIGSSTPIGAQVLFRHLPFNWRLAYIPKGPLGWKPGEENSTQGWKLFVNAVDDICRPMKTVLLILEPDLWRTELPSPPEGFQNAIQTIQPPRTIIVDLSGGEEEVLARMKQKTRYNIRLAQKKGIEVCQSTDVEAFYNLMLVTGQRDEFGVHSLDYYQQTYCAFYPRGECELFIASYAGEPLAGLMVFARGSRSWYFYGSSSDQHREMMPTYLIQWEAIRWSIQRGCKSYDLWGVPDFDEETLEADFMHRSDGLWGVYRFKRGFGGDLRRAAGSFERVYKPALYKAYRWWLKRRNQAAE